VNRKEFGKKLESLRDGLGRGNRTRFLFVGLGDPYFLNWDLKLKKYF